jgi:valyl-tRNA synthetase
MMKSVGPTDDRRIISVMDSQWSQRPSNSMLPASYNPTESERKWREHWQTNGVYHWDPARPRESTFVVDTPPPTVSGSLHIGHVFSYTHTDLLVRYKRMRGLNIMYPIGWDDNGLPTERRVQNKYGITCNPNLPYIHGWIPTESVGAATRLVEVSRPNFIEACTRVTSEDELAFANLWRQLGLSVDWRLEYNTVGERSRHVSQLSFLDLVEKGLAYQADSPTIWDITFNSAVAQAELEDREIGGHFYDIKFAVRGGGSFVLATTRPELLPACIAIVAHPDDARYRGLFGKEAICPVFGTPVPIRASQHADPEKGTGIMMVCTFGDGTDVAWWKASGLPSRSVIGRDGRLLPVVFGTDAFPSVDPERANAAYGTLVGLKIPQAREAIARILAEPNSSPDGQGPALQSEPRQIKHAVKFYEKGNKPVEFVTSRQWYINILDHRTEFLTLGAKVHWHPDHMRLRYEDWINGLNSDWCISRQRFFGVPFPVWYPIDGSGAVDYSRPILAPRDRLPVDPMSDVPPGYAEKDRNVPDGFAAEPDVMDTWATSSVTPQIVCRWGLDGDLSAKLFPMDVRPQGPEIIRTWAFYTIVKSWAHTGGVPWHNAVISGWILDPDRKKMSKSKGNVVTPGHLLDQYSADAVRYWAARARLGTDTAIDEEVFKSGRKVSLKIFNATKFVLGQLTKIEGDLDSLSLADVSQAGDRAWLRRLHDAIESSTAAFEEFDHAGALAAVEARFWDFCDNYLELAKSRGYQGESSERRSALATLKWSIDVFLHLFAPFVPYVVEEVWSYCPWKPQDCRSIHVTAWPKAEDLLPACGPTSREYDLAIEVLGAVRRAKSAASKGVKWPVARLEVACTPHDLACLNAVMGDIVQAGSLLPGAFQLSAGQGDLSDVQVKVTLSDTPGKPGSES